MFDRWYAEIPREKLGEFTAPASAARRFPPQPSPAATAPLAGEGAGRAERSRAAGPQRRRP